MRILHLSAGTGSFYCGTCIRDNALVTALRRQGCDASLLPLYLPMKLDEGDSTDCPLFFGGINVFLQEKSGVFRHTPRWFDQILDAEALLNWSAKFQHMTRANDLGALTLSMLRAEEGNQAKEFRRMIDWLKGQEPYDAVCLSNLLLAGFARRMKAELKIPVICTMQGEDSFLDDLPGDFGTEAWRLLKERCADCDAFIAVSDFYKKEMIERLSLPGDRVHSVRNGILLEGYEPARAEPSPLCIGYLARMCPPKGLHLVVDAFIDLKRDAAHGDLRLLLVGSCTKGDKPYLKEQREKLRAAGVLDDVRVFTNVSREEKQRLLREMTVLSVPACYGEAFGLYILEALASGVPVVQPRRGAFPEIVDATGGGWLYDPEEGGKEATMLAHSLSGSLKDDEGRRQRAEQGRRAVEERFSITAMAEAVAGVYRQVVAAREERDS